MRFAAVRGVLAAALLCAAFGPGCDDVVPVAPGPAEPPEGEVWGRVVGLDGAPEWHGPPLWIGEQRAPVAADGTFRFTGVQTPYDLTMGVRNVVPADDYSTTLYQGVTTRTPVVYLPYWSGSSYGGSAFVTGRVPYVPRWRTRIIVVTSDGRAESAWADGISATYALEIRWGHGETNRVTIYALRYDQNNVLQDRYQRSLSLKDDERRVLDLDHAVFSPAPTRFVNGSFRTEPYTQDRQAEFLVRFGRVSINLGAVQADARFPDAFSFDVPYFPAATYQVKVRATWHAENAFYFANASFADVQPGVPARALLHPGPQLVAPFNAASDVEMGETLRWAPQGGSGVYRLQIRGYSGHGWNQEVKIYTARTDFVLTDIPALQMFMRPGVNYYWSVEQLPASATVDGVVAGRLGEEDSCGGAEYRFSTPAAPPATHLSADLP